MEQFVEAGTQCEATLDYGSLIKTHLPAVKAIASKIRGKIPAPIELDDLIQTGVLGLMDAAAKYDAKKGVPFSMYAKFRIRGSILDSLRRLDGASRSQRKNYRKAEAVTNELAMKLQRMPTQEEVADELHIDVKRLGDLLSGVRNLSVISTTAARSDEPDAPDHEFVGPADTRPDRLSERAQLRDILAKAMHVLPPRYSQVVSLYYLDQMTMCEIGEVLCINESRVSQIRKKALEIMAVTLQNAGICSSQAA